MLTFKIPFLFHFWNFMLFPGIKLDKLVIKVISFLYLGFISVCRATLATILAFFVPYLLKFCYCHSVIFATAPSLTSLRFSRLCILCCSIATITEWAKINVPSSVHSSKLILFSYQQIVL